VTLAQRSVGRALPGRQGRLVFAYLACNRGRAVPRDELTGVLWPAKPPRSPEDVLGALLSKLRGILGAGALVGRRDVMLVLPPDISIDIELAEQAVERAQEALAADDATLACNQALLADDVLAGDFLSEHDNEWVQERRRELQDLRLDALECVARAALALGGPRLAAGERAARQLISREPLRERGYRLLMEVTAARGEIPAALQTYEELRVRLRDELGIAPTAAVRALHERLLTRNDVVDAPASPAAESTLRDERDERKLVTVLLADVVAAEDIERTRAWLDRVREVASAEVEAAGGVLGSSAGGAIVATFGAPAAQEDHAERALRVANALNAKLGGIVPLRVAVESGEIIAGRVGLTGPPFTAAMKLLSGASGGQVLVGTRASAARHRRHPREGGVRGALFVGRGAELEAIRAEYRRACADARPRLVTIVGDAGVGKSRLAEEFVAGLSAESRTSAPSRLSGCCISYGHALTYRALGDVLCELLGVRETDSRDEIIERLGSRRILGLTLGLDVAGDLHPLAAVERLRIAWRDVLGELVADRPAVVLVEDLHWAQPDLLDLLEYLTDGVDGPLLLVSTARPELLSSRPSWGRRRDATTMWLEPLPPDDAARLAAEAPEHLREAVLEQTEGNPFFIEELVAQVGAGGDAVAIPDSVKAVLAARIDRLPPLEKHALQSASVIGRAFWREPVRGLLGDALPNFELLEEHDFVRPRARSSFEGMRELAFKHALTREVAYASIPHARRLRLHASFARWLEAFGGGRDEHAALLAHHYAEAVRPQEADLAWVGADAEHDELRRQAIAWLRRAAELAIGRYEIDDGIALLRRAFELEHNDDARCELWTAVARASALKFDGEAFWTAMETALSLARDDRTRAEICGWLAVESYVRAGMWTRTPALERVGEWVASALELAPPGTASRARALIAKACRNVDDAEAAAEAAAIAQRLDDPELCVHAWDACATVAMAAADYEAAWEWRTRRLRLLDRISDPDLRTIISETPYSACIATCRFDQAREIARLNAELTRSLTPHHRLHGAAILVEVEELLGEWRTIIDLEGRVRDAVAANTHNPCLRNARSLLVCAIAAACLSDADKAAELERAADDLGMQRNPMLDTPRLRLALLRGDRDHASELLHRIEANQGWYLRGHGTSLTTLIARLDAHVTLGHRDQVERDATRLALPGTFVEPFALRALGIVRDDRALLDRATARFSELALEWHAQQTRAARSSPAPAFATPGASRTQGSR
jgi:DNA-binding SARP family transcriptional activator